MATQESKYNTNLASEFYVLSMLHRLGADALLTIGNKKSVDIFVEFDQGHRVTLDVKGLAGKTSWPVDNIKGGKSDHFIVLVCYYGKIDDTKALPECWIIPCNQLNEFVYESPKGRRVVNRSTLLKDGRAATFKDNWESILRFGHT